MSIFDKTTEERKTFLVYGMGVSGKGVARLLHAVGADIILFDKNEALDREAVLAETGLPADTRFILGSMGEDVMNEFDIVALSPGVSIYADDIKAAASAGKKILGEIELAYEAGKGRLVAITGTNGKTTTTALTGEIMKAAFADVHVVGNIGTSYASVADTLTEESVTVAEISSFQLESIEEFHPEVSAILNLTPDHLDRHFTFENYALAKCQIARNQTPEDKCIINYDDEYLRKLSEDLTPEIIYFSRKVKLDKGVYLDGQDIIYNDGVTAKKVVSRPEITLMGDHNVENVMAAIGIAAAMGVDLDVTADVIRHFQAVEHRIEYVCTRRGVAYYNDSKGTNTDASQKAVESMVAPTILIAGGYDKGADFTDWINCFNGRVKLMILIGKTAEKIRETALKCGFDRLIMAGDLKTAVDVAVQEAEEGDAVLLSPACASWDQFKSYEQRGRLFKEYARAIPE